MNICPERHPCLVHLLEQWGDSTWNFCGNSLNCLLLIIFLKSEGMFSLSDSLEINFLPTPTWWTTGITKNFLLHFWKFLNYSWHYECFLDASQGKRFSFYHERPLFMSFPFKQNILILGLAVWQPFTRHSLPLKNCVLLPTMDPLLCGCVTTVSGYWLKKY